MTNPNPLREDEVEMVDNSVDQALRAALVRSAEVMEWLADNQPDCFGWEPPYPSTTPTIKVEAEAARAAILRLDQVREGRGK